MGQDYWYYANHEFESYNKKSDAIRAKFNEMVKETIEEALAQPEQDYPENFIHALAFHTALSDLKPEQKPVAWRVWNPDGEKQYAYSENGDGEPLYTTPPHRKKD